MRDSPATTSIGCRTFTLSMALCEVPLTGAPEAAEAIALFVYRIVREIGSLAAALGGLDGLVFTAGIGENDPNTRAEVVAGCAWLGLMLDAARNAAGNGRISADAAPVQAWVVPTDEERLIARHSVEVLRQWSSSSAVRTEGG